MKLLDDIKLSDRDRRAIAAAAALLREKYPVEDVILFGSKARGEATRDSDIDLLILTRDRLSWPQRDQITNMLFDLQLEMGVLLSVLVVSVEEWNEGLYQVMPIREEIERDGVLV